MKATILTVISMFILLVCCKGKDGKTQDFIPGIYVHSFTDSINELTKTVGNDTLEVKAAINKEVGFYEIQRKIKYQRTVDGTLKPEEYKQEFWKGVYDKEMNILLESTRNKVISFNPEKGILLVNTVEYKKLI